MPVAQSISGRAALGTVDAPVDAARQTSFARRRPRMTAIAVRYLTLLALLALWQVAIDVFLPGNNYIASPSEIVGDGLGVLTERSTLSALQTTAERYLVAFVVAAVAGVAIGLLLSRVGRFVPPARNILYVLYTVPQVPFYPIFLLWFGFGFRSEVAFGISHGMIPVIFGTMAATAQVDPKLLDSARSMGAGPLTRVRTVLLPSIVPGVVGALRIGASLCLIGVLLAELLVSVDGIGGVIGQLAGTLQPAQLDATILAVSVAAVLVNTIIRLVERRVSRWRAMENN